MEEKDMVKFKKEEFAMRELIKSNLGKGKVSEVRIEYTPIGEKIVISTSKPGLVIGRKGEKITELNRLLKANFKLENPQIEIEEVLNPDFDAQGVADEIALSLERFGPLKFKVVAYRMLQRIVEAGALGVEIRLSGKLPSRRAKTWRFAQGYLKKTGHSAKVVHKAQAIAQTRPGTVGVKVSILSPDAILSDRVTVDEKLLASLREHNQIEPEKVKTVKKKKAKK